MRPHPFFLVAIGLLTLALVIALSVPAREPAVALHTVLVFRVEVALILLGAGYFVGIVLWLAWHGRTLRRVELPGGAALEAPELAQLDRAADRIDRSLTDAEVRLDEHDSAIYELIERIEALERG